MNRLRNRLILLFLAGTVLPLGLTIWFAVSLLERSLSYTATRELDEISKSLERTGREFYQRSREMLKSDAESGRTPPLRHLPSDRDRWPQVIRDFWDSGEPERFYLSGQDGNRLNYLVRRGGEVEEWSRSLGPVAMERLARDYRRARALVETGRTRDLRRGFILTFLLLALGAWLASLILLVFLASWVSRPIQSLTAGLARLASGDLAARVPTDREDEVGRAIRAFNDMAGQLETSRQRLIYLTQLASWQTLARKMAHELKNSLTPIRLTMEELRARGVGDDRAFLERASQIVIEEVESLERRVRAFSAFAAEPAVRPEPLDVNTLLEERVALLRPAHPEVCYQLRLAPELPRAFADSDIVKGVLTNLLENAAEAAGPGGQVLGTTQAVNGDVAVEVHDSGPGLSEEARKSLFEPAISFKKGGMGLGLSIARRSALLSGGDIRLVDGALGGAGFRVVFPSESHASKPNPGR
jgi:nitrogen fixation/metabolism regulation signal transduction histidine kinase